MITLELTLTNETAELLLQGFNEQRERIALEMGREDMDPEREDQLTKMLAAVAHVYNPLYQHQERNRELDRTDFLDRQEARAERARRGEKVRLPA